MFKHKIIKSRKNILSLVEATYEEPKEKHDEYKNSKKKEKNMKKIMKVSISTRGKCSKFSII